jgi:hypothetical protein
VKTSRALLFICMLSALAANPPNVDALAAKGVRFKVEKDGTVTEASVGGKATITIEDYALLGAMRSLKRADVSPESARLNDDTAKSLASLEQLEKFFANGAELTDDGFKAFAGWKNLKSFGLDHWGWYAPGHLPQKGALGPGLAHLASCTQLESLRLGGCRVDNRVTLAIAQIKSLQSVDLQHTYAVSDEGIRALQALPKLRIVKLSPQFSPRITDASLAALAEIKTLEEIEINETWLTYALGFTHLQKLASLKKIVLTKVIATEADITHLKADHPGVEVKWTQPDEAIVVKTKEQFQRFWDKQAKGK